jgi:hypothetical protein
MSADDLPILARALAARLRRGTRRFAKGEAMNISKNDIFEALGIRESGSWVMPAAIGFGVGAVLGATVALFLAPRAGSDLRGEILQRGRRAMERVRERAGEEMSSTTHNH